MNMENLFNAKSNSPSDAERLFLGLVREGMMSYYVGRASQLSEDELRSVFAVAHAAMREAERREIAELPVKSAAPAEQQPEARPEKKKSPRSPGIYPS